MKMSSQKGGGTSSGTFGLASNSQSNGYGMSLGMGGAVGNRGHMLGPMGPHMNSLEGYRTNPAGLLVRPHPHRKLTKQELLFPMFIRFHSEYSLYVSVGVFRWFSDSYLISPSGGY